MEPISLLAEYESADAFLAAHDQQIAAGGLLVRGASLPAGTPLGECTLVVRVSGGEEAEATARLAGATPGLGVTVLFPAPPTALLELARRLREAGAAPPEPQGSGKGEQPDGDEEHEAERRAEGSASGAQRPALTMPEKMALALSGGREARLQLLRDPNKQLHPLVLKNPRIGLEEVQWAARATTLNPDALKLIAEHPEWGQSPAVAAALVRNPKTPVPVALKLLPRLAAAELRAIAKSQGRPPIVQAAKKLLVRA